MALMEKQLAKFLDKPLSLWARVIQHEYNPTGDVWRLQPRRAASQVWRAEVSSCQVLRQGLQREVGKGDWTSFLNDPWVTSFPLKLRPNWSVPSGLSEDVKVQEFITTVRCWDNTRLISRVGQEVARDICRIPLPLGVLDDLSGMNFVRFQ